MLWMIIAQKICFIASFALIAVLYLFEALALSSTWPTWFDLENKLKCFHLISPWLEDHPGLSISMRR